MDATSRALPRRQIDVERVDVTRDNLATGADLCGPNPDVHSGDRWRERANLLHPGTALARANTLEVALANVASVRLDLARAGIDARQPWSVDVHGDGPTAVELSGLRAGGVAFTEGREVRIGDDGSAVVELLGGSGVVTGGR